jgi:hypothetical protein
MNIHEIILSLHKISIDLSRMGAEMTDLHSKECRHMEHLAWNMYRSANELRMLKPVLVQEKDKVA